MIPSLWICYKQRNQALDPVSQFIQTILGKSKQAWKEDWSKNENPEASLRWTHFQLVCYGLDTEKSQKQGKMYQVITEFFPNISKISVSTVFKI